MKINVVDREGKSSRRYVLYAYSEGKYIERVRAMKFTGIPVLFVPGHGGSFKQVRSLASVTTHRTLDLQSIFHFDFFTIDFDGELSALYGGTLKAQHEFIVLSVDRVLKLYPVQSRPKSVVIIGHSMGGMIARSLFMGTTFDPLTVKLIITLATPHKPVILMDKELKDLYWSMDVFWKIETRKPNSRLQNLTMISIGGGTKDILVRPGQTYDKHADLNVVTSAIPDVITSTDHLCIVWCNNFIKALSRALYDAVDFEIKGITEDKEHLRNIFYYHLVHRTNGKYYSADIHQDRIKFVQKNVTWTEIKKLTASIMFPFGVDQDTHIAIKKPENVAYYDSVLIESVNIDKRDWIAECNPTFLGKQVTHCDNAINLSRFGTVGFNGTLNRKYLRMSLNSPRKTQATLTHFVVRLPVTTEETGVNVDVYNKKSRTTEVDLKFFQPFRSQTVIESTKRGALFYTLRLNNMVTMWRVYHLNLLPLKCTEESHAAYAVFKTPWSHDSSHVKVNGEESQVLKLILQTIPPARIDDFPSVDLILDPACTYTVKIEPSYANSLAIIAVRYSFTLLPNVAALTMLVLAAQYQSFGETECCPSFLSALTRRIEPFFAYPLVKLITYYWSYLELDLVVGQLDTQLLLEDTADDAVVPLVIHLVSFALLYMIGLCLGYSIRASVFIYEKSVIGCSELLKRMCMIREQYDEVEFMCKMLPFLSAAFTWIISLLMCDGHGLLIGLIFYYVKICCIYKKCLDVKRNALEDGRLKGIILTVADDQLIPKMNSVHLHSSLFLLWSFCAITFLPSSIMWYRNMGFDSYVEQDLNIGISVMYCCAIGFIWFCNIPLAFLARYQLFHRMFITIACLIVLTCQVNVFRLPTLLTLVFLIVAGHQYGGLVGFELTSSKFFICQNSDHVCVTIMRFYKRWQKRND